MRLILQGIRAETHLAALQRFLRDPATERIILSVAYLRSAGLDLLTPDLAACANRIRVFAGVRNGITSRQSLQQLLETGAQLFAVDTGTTGVTYHPKLYLASSATGACLIVGSANLTVGGLHNNIEASLEVQLDLTNPSDLDFYQSTARQLGAALLRRRPNQSLRQRGRRQLDPSRRGEGAAEGTGGRWYLCRQRRLGVFRWYSRAWWRVSVRINAPAARGGLRTVATAAKCHRAPVDYHPVAGQMPRGLQ